MKAPNGEGLMDQSKMKAVYVITERGEKSFWNRIGVAFTNRDGSLSVRLDALPMNGQIHIRDWEPREWDGRPRNGRRFAPPTMAEAEHAL